MTGSEILAWLLCYKFSVLRLTTRPISLLWSKIGPLEVSHFYFFACKFQHLPFQHLLWKSYAFERWLKIPWRGLANSEIIVDIPRQFLVLISVSVTFFWHICLDVVVYSNSNSFLYQFKKIWSSRKFFCSMYQRGSHRMYICKFSLNWN